MKTNVLFILTDQWPAWAFGFNQAPVHTPAIDTLAARGTVFSNAFTSCPLCTPARAALLTSRWAHETGMLDNYGLGYSRQLSLGANEFTWLDQARESGFFTGYFGKWHLGPDGPILRGVNRHDPHFDKNFTVYDPQTNNFNYASVKAGYAAALKNTGNRDSILKRGCPPFYGELKAPKKQCEPFVIAARGMDFIAEHARMNTDAPFFLTLSFPGPHFPHYLPAEYAALADALNPILPPSLHDTFEGKPDFHAGAWWPSMETATFSDQEWKKIIAYSQAHITMTDEAIGRVLYALSRHPAGNNTIIIFTSDHGDMQGAHGRFDKGPYFYEEVWRVPLIICRPDSQSAGQRVFVSMLDIGETLFRLAGGKTSTRRSGRDLNGLCGSSWVPGFPDIAYGAYDLYNGMSFYLRAVRDRRYKYVHNPQAMDELYDLQEDPFEMRNLAGQAQVQPVQNRLSGLLTEWMKKTGDNAPAPDCAAGHVPVIKKQGP